MNLTVSQLISALSNLDPDMRVVFSCPSSVHPYLVKSADTVKVEAAYDFDGYRNLDIVLKASFSSGFDPQRASRGEQIPEVDVVVIG